MIENPEFSRSSRAKIELKQPRLPFVIRAHHLENFYTILKGGGGVSVTDIVAENMERISRNRNPSYKNDVLGSTQEQANNFKTHLTEFYEEFLELPGDYPIKIVVNHKDKICQGCAIGEHCDKRSRRIWPFSEGGDVAYAKVFIKAAKKLNLVSEMNISEETASYSDAKPRKVKSILTTAKTVKDVMLSRYPGFSWLALKSVIDL